MAWTCPACSREFARRGQGHECAPALTVEEYFAGAPPFERPVFAAVDDHLRAVGDPHYEFLAVGVFVKRDGVTFAQLRTMTRWVALNLWLPRLVQDPRISRKPIRSGTRVVHVVNVATSEQVDDVVRDWLVEAWSTAR